MGGRGVSRPELPVRLHDEQQTLAGGTGNALVFSHTGGTIYARSGHRAIVPDIIQGFAFDPVTGQIGQAATLRIDNVAGFTGVAYLDSMAMSSDGTFLLAVEEAPAPRIAWYSTTSGALLGFRAMEAQPRGIATPRRCAAAQTAIEFRHPEFDHYFVTTIPNEIAMLDNGAIAGWTRTSEAFAVRASGTPGTAATCRFFGNSFGLKSSHFYTPVASECATVKANPVWQFEGEVFNMTLPAADGGCPSTEMPLYRLYNAGQGSAPNHRYTTKLDVRAEMAGRGRTPEGNGIGVIGCVPLAAGTSLKKPVNLP